MLLAAAIACIVGGTVARTAAADPTYIENLTFVDQGGWKLSHDSAMTLIQSVRSSGH